LLRKRVVYDTHRKAIEFALVTYRCDRFSPTLTLQWGFVTTFLVRCRSVSVTAPLFGGKRVRKSGVPPV
jgi:hypothetical protein